MHDFKGYDSLKESEMDFKSCMTHYYGTATIESHN